MAVPLQSNGYKLSVINVFMYKRNVSNFSCIKCNMSLPIVISSHLGTFLVKIGRIFEENHVTQCIKLEPVCI